MDEDDSKQRWEFGKLILVICIGLIFGCCGALSLFFAVKITEPTPITPTPWTLPTQPATNTPKPVTNTPQPIDTVAVPTETPEPTETLVPTDTPKPILTETPMWYMGGTLHDATAVTWIDSTPRNKLATAADWIAVLSPNYEITKLEDMANELVDCVNAATDELEIVEDIAVNEIALTCAILLNYVE